MAVEAVFGAQVAWHCEYDAAASKVLAHRYPGIPNLGDITQIDWSELVSCKPDTVGTFRMYDLYCQGNSLAEVAAIEGVTRQSVYSRFVRQGLSMRSRPKPKPFVEYDGRRFTIGDHGYYRATSGDRDLLHRVMWKKERGPIPDGWDIHHLDHDKTHNEISNFELLTKSDHARLYNMGCNGSGHKCQGGDANASFAVDVLAAGWP